MEKYATPHRENSRILKQRRPTGKFQESSELCYLNTITQFQSLDYFFFHAISLFICFAGYSHVQTVSRLRSALLNLFLQPQIVILCVLFSETL